MTKHTLQNLSNDDTFEILISDDEYCPMDFQLFNSKLNEVESSFSGSTTSKGRTLEDLACYLLNCVIPFKVTYDEKTPMNQFDGLIEVLPFRGHNPFLHEIGMYLVAECKNENKPVDITHVSKVQNILCKHRINMGIIFGRKHITGVGKFEGAQAEIISSFRGNGMKILSITFSELKAVCLSQTNFLTFLKQKERTLRFMKLDDNKLSTELKKYGELLRDGILTQDDFETIKQSLIDSYAS